MDTTLPVSGLELGGGAGPAEETPRSVLLCGQMAFCLANTGYTLNYSITTVYSYVRISVGMSSKYYYLFCTGHCMLVTFQLRLQQVECLE